MKLRLLDEAESELRQVMLYYEQCRQGLGHNFHERVTDVLSAVRNEPLRFPIYEGRRLRREYRRARVVRFPYIIVFQIRADEVVVVALAHTSRAPGYWNRRN